MIAAEIIGKYCCAFYTRQNIRRDEEIVYAPADIAVASAGLHIPVRIRIFLCRMEMPEYVYVAVRDDFIHPCAFHRKESGILFILFRPGKIDSFMRRIDIAAEDYLVLFLAECVAKIQKGIVEFQFIFQPFRTAAAIGEITVDEHEILVVGDERAPFIIKFFDAQSGDFFGFSL